VSTSTSGPPVVIEAPAQRDILRSLGLLARGLSALFWGLPIALVVCVQCARGDWFRPLGVIPPLLATGLLFYGLSLLGGFQKQERVWMQALDRARLVGLVNAGLSPFLFWAGRVPSNEFFNAVVDLLMLGGVAFLFLLNPLLVRLTAMLPDEALRLETRAFANMNRVILGALGAGLFLYLVMVNIHPALPARTLGWLLANLPLPPQAAAFLQLIERGGVWLVLFPILFPVAMTMALLWKIKAVILENVFGGGPG
jgi:hypothetical protein